ncbi:MAG: AtpZ/AtpI family protein [candidate division KSB1 bacterium]|nr:AtpZ/AtpI family protein [candidate division KSB1 bacterium]MDZ7385656.1 AtpZ/AtpI family protein [candidate division KSB1 bacterium]MDZ7394124.1 AtpZ/AtpI family protein [candidate division KSB1 bacterium]MDZ7414388.1 AtpZ/AtpI family protein [candidate division KSB1 bacterium]
MPGEPPSSAVRQVAYALGAVGRVSVLIMVSVGGPLALGLWLDRTLRTSPWLLLVGMVVGVVLCVVSVARVSRMQ